MQGADHLGVLGAGNIQEQAVGEIRESLTVQSEQISGQLNPRCLRMQDCEIRRVLVRAWSLIGLTIYSHGLEFHLKQWFVVGFLD